MSITNSGTSVFRSNYFDLSIALNSDSTVSGSFKYHSKKSKLSIPIKGFYDHKLDDKITLFFILTLTNDGTFKNEIILSGVYTYFNNFSQIDLNYLLFFKSTCLPETIINGKFHLNSKIKAKLQKCRFINTINNLQK